MIAAQDTALVPEPMFESLTAKSTIADYVQSDAFEIKKITALAFTASTGELDNMKRLKDAIGSKDPVERYWGALGFRIHGTSAAANADSLLPLLKDSHPVIRTTAAEALFVCGRKDTASAALLADVNTSMDESSLLNLLNTLRRLNLLDQLPKDWAKGKSWNDGYIQRFFENSKGQ